MWLKTIGQITVAGGVLGGVIALSCHYAPERFLPIAAVATLVCWGVIAVWLGLRVASSGGIGLLTVALMHWYVAFSLSVGLISQVLGNDIGSYSGGFWFCALPPCWGLGAVAMMCRVRSRQKDDPECAECGYNLTGNVSGTCPECGNKYRDLKTRQMKPSMFRKSVRGEL